MPIAFDRCMTELALGQIVVSASKYLVGNESASRGCEQRQCGLWQLLEPRRGRSGIGLVLEELLCGRCSQIFAKLNQKRHFLT